MRTPFMQKGSILSTCAVVMIVGGLVAAEDATGAPLKVAYAHVLGNGTLDTANSRNVVAMGGGNGLYCFKLTFTPKNAVATIANDPTGPAQGLDFIMVAVPPTALFTCSTIPKPDAVVSTSKETTVGGGTSAGGHAFYVYWTR
jgi:hypothetical protein